LGRVLGIMFAVCCPQQMAVLQLLCLQQCIIFYYVSNPEKALLTSLVIYGGYRDFCWLAVG
jgi:hypothetical protein